MKNDPSDVMISTYRLGPYGYWYRTPLVDIISEHSGCAVTWTREH